MQNIFNIPENVLWNTPGCLVWKDVNSVFLGCNKIFAEVVGFKNIDACIGKTEFDMPCEAVSNAENFISQDKKVISSQQQIKYLDIGKYADGNVGCFLSEKRVLSDLNGEIIGTVSHATIIENVFLATLSKLLFNPTPHACLKDLLGCYEIGGTHKKNKLTLREEEILFYLIRGKTTKEIARILNISPRTVETHIDNLKIKFQIHNKAELIATCIEKGLLYTIPDSFIKSSIPLT